MPASLSSSLPDLQARFLSIVPRIMAHGRVYFRDVKCPGKKDDALAEMIALSWQWFVRLVEKGKDPTAFVSAIAGFAAKAVSSGRRLCGQEKAKDVLSAVAQQRNNFAVCELPQRMSFNSTPLQEALIDNTKTPPDEQAAFRIDFPCWLSSLDQHRRRITEDLMMGERTLDVANRHGCSSARISQLRRECQQDWLRFCGDLPAETTSRTTAVA
jgi:hypothetical protein